jgi:D-amino-acid oxidase
MSKVTVLGGGVVGLSSAIRLSESGHDVTVVARDYLRGTTSWVATAIWHLFRVEIDARVERWATETLEELLRLADLEATGVTVIRGVECIRADSAEAKELEAGTTESLWKSVVPYIALTRDEVVARLPPTYPVDSVIGGYEIEVPIADMSIYLPYLMEMLTRRGVTRHTDDVATFDALRSAHPADVYVNCTGLGARELAGDTYLHGVKGQIIRVAGTGVSSYFADGDAPSGVTYILPRSTDTILGGTDELDVEDAIVDPVVADRILERCVGLEPALARGEILEHLAGVRPYRRGSVRVEAEGDVVHNYGHGGSGVSLSWGCADEVSRLVTATLAESGIMKR